MRRAGVICEFNPFHNGHKFLLEKVKSEYADQIACVMSGSFVQRGEIAVTDKFARTAAALTGGADLVAELPTVYAVAPAQIFAQSGVFIARELGCDCLCFGAESSLTELYSALEALSSDTAQAKIAAGMKRGSSYPRALSEAVGEEHARVISQPNNILALEYIRACRACGIEPIAVPRVGAAHDSPLPCGGIASASSIRDRIARGEDIAAYTPMTVDPPARADRIESALLYRLKTMTPEELAALPDVSEGLENRIAAVAKEYYSLKEISEHLKTKRYTMARLRRILCAALLGMTRGMQQTPVPYLRVLGVRADKKRLITSDTLPLIVDVKSGYDRLDDSAKEIFDVDLRATALMNIATKETKNDFSQGLIIR